jgi:hypothetical protein
MISNHIIDLGRIDNMLNAREGRMTYKKLIERDQNLSDKNI